MSRAAPAEGDPRRPPGPRSTPLAIDREALLAALVIAPATYSRNRFFELYKDPAIGRVRRRASQIRSIVRHLARAVPSEPAEILGVAPAAGDRVELTYVVPALGLRRTALLEPIELSLVRFAVARARGDGGPPPDDPDRARVEAALARLATGPCPAQADAREAPL
jgi:hypothetical protein